MEKLSKVNNEIYLLMQDIIKLTENNISNTPAPLFSHWLYDVSIRQSDLLFKPTEDQLEKALMELKFMFGGWVSGPGDYSKTYIHFINFIGFSKDFLSFKISSDTLKQLATVNYVLGDFIERYID